MVTPGSTRFTSRAPAPVLLALLMLTGACGEDVAPVPEHFEEEPVQPQAGCPPRPPMNDPSTPLNLTCADAPELCAEAVSLHQGASPLGVVDLLFVPRASPRRSCPPTNRRWSSTCGRCSRTSRSPPTGTG
jgi:hypothetical protein